MIKIKPNYFMIPLIIVVISTLGGFFVEQGMDWYKSLIFPAIVPPGWVFSLAWQIIFILTGASILVIWNLFPRNNRFLFIVGLLILNGFLNVFWSYLFFYNHSMIAALVDVILLIATLIALVVLTYPVSYKTSLLLMPYLMWCFFALYLNGMFVYLN